MRLDNKVAIVTGGAGGIGQSVVSAFLAEGARVVIADRDSLQLKNVLQKLKAPGRVTGVRVDVSRPADVIRLIGKTLATYGTVDVLVNMAAVQKPIGSLDCIDENEWIDNIKTNLIGTMLTCKYVLPVMMTKKAGKIINFSGGGATFPRPNYSAYASAKAAIVRFTETIAMEVAAYGIDVNAISPGPVYTRMLEEIIEAGDRSNRDDLETAVRIKKQGGRSPQGIAEMAMFLASDESNHLTGKLLSAVWDNPEYLKQNIAEVNKSSLYTLRRVDGTKVYESKA